MATCSASPVERLLPAPDEVAIEAEPDFEEQPAVRSITNPGRGSGKSHFFGELAQDSAHRGAQIAGPAALAPRRRLQCVAASVAALGLGPARLSFIALTRGSRIATLRLAQELV